MKKEKSFIVRHVPRVASSDDNGVGYSMLLQHVNYFFPHPHNNPIVLAAFVLV